jgi:hypothetical protein
MQQDNPGNVKVEPEGGVVRPGEPVKVTASKPGVIVMTPRDWPPSPEKSEPTNGKNDPKSIPHGLPAGKRFLVVFYPDDGGPIDWFEFEVVDSI